MEDAELSMWQPDRNPPTFRGLVNVVHNITEEEIAEVIKSYRALHPNSQKTDEDLRPIASNTILLKRKTRP